MTVSFLLALDFFFLWVFIGSTPTNEQNSLKFLPFPIGFYVIADVSEADTVQW